VEHQSNLNSSPVQTSPTIVSSNWFPIVFSLITLVVGIFLGIEIGRSQIQNQQTISTGVTISPTGVTAPTVQAVVPTVEPSPLLKGKVEGKICYPSDYVPKGYILAKNVETNKIDKTSFEGVPPKTQDYSLNLDVGKYVFAYDPGGNGNYMGYFTSCAPTMNVANCSTNESHKLIEVTVTANKTVSGVDLCDYYYQPNQKPNF